MSNILVVAEHNDGTLAKATLTCVSFAQEAAKRTGGVVHGLVTGSGTSAVAEELAKYVSVVHHADAPAFEHSLAETKAQAITIGADAAQASVVAMAATAHGKDTLPRAAALNGAGMASDIIGFAADSGLQFLRPIQAGNIIAACEIATERKYVSTRPTDFEAAEELQSPGTVQALTVNVPSPKTRFVQFAKVASNRPQLTEATTVVSGGRGLKDAKGFPELIEPLADKLSAAIGASRAVVDSGWVPNDMQVGQTGKVVAPNLYIAVGISGAIQHVAGMKGSKTIVAINKDPEAPIFQVADYGLVEDLFKAIPELTSKL
ncbi:MAG: electron transfer flavoprotein subunit alpha/FixB family protein [Myxococcales bacterium]|nr:electron transfer flavoprotein subunit alpha/FixB family protein [Myxococcales bacterium]